MDHLPGIEEGGIVQGHGFLPYFSLLLTVCVSCCSWMNIFLLRHDILKKENSGRADQLVANSKEAGRRGL